MLSDCNLNRKKYGRLTDEEYSILCGFLFPYSQDTSNISVKAVDLVENPLESIQTIIDNNEERNLMKALESKKRYSGVYYFNETELYDYIFDSMIVVEPNVKGLIENFNLIRITLNNELQIRSKLILDNLMDEIGLYIDQNQSKVKIKYSENEHINLLKDIRSKTQNLNELSNHDLILLKNKEFMLFLMN